jgi:hypothetical protein
VLFDVKLILAAGRLAAARLNPQGRTVTVHPRLSGAADPPCEASREH